MAETRDVSLPPNRFGHGARGMMVVKPQNMKGTLGRLWSLTKGHRQGLGWIFVLSGLSAGSAILSPKIIGKLINDIDENNPYFILLSVLLAVYIGDWLIRFLQQFFMASIGQRMIGEIEDAKAVRDSVGGIVEVMATGFPGGIGSPMWDTVESAFAQLAFGIPAVKGVSVGSGFQVASRRGSENNDHLLFQDGKLRMATNHGGGFEGGISNGMPILAQVAFKPTPSISREQETVNLETKENVTIEIPGRHDAFIVPRALPVVEGCLALALLDVLMGKGEYNL